MRFLLLLAALFAPIAAQAQTHIVVWDEWQTSRGWSAAFFDAPPGYFHTAATLLSFDISTPIAGTVLNRNGGLFSEHLDAGFTGTFFPNLSVGYGGWEAIEFYADGAWGTHVTLTLRNLTFAVDDAVIRAVPEPAAWGMLIGGFGLAGMALRHRRLTVRYA